MTDEPERSRYVAFLDGVPAGHVDYHAQGGLVTLLHTEIAPELEGQGVGSQIVAAVLDDVRRRGVQVFPVCPFVRAFLRRHPEYADLVGLA